MYVGIFKIRKPAILVRDPELIKDMLIKNFSHFHDNDIEIDEAEDPIMAKNPFCLRGHKWKVVRGQVSANITTGKVWSLLHVISTLLSIYKGRKFITVNILTNMRVAYVLYIRRLFYILRIIFIHIRFSIFQINTNIRNKQVV